MGKKYNVSAYYYVTSDKKFQVLFSLVIFYGRLYKT
jgi:hypothetical protein